MEAGDEPEWLVVQRRRRQESTNRLAGLSTANLWVVVPALVSLPIMGIFGEGDYIVPVLGMLWAGLFVLGLRMRRSAPAGNVARSRSFWICLWSFILSGLMIVVTVAFIADGAWQ
jgi:hypothetical protein